VSTIVRDVSAAFGVAAHGSAGRENAAAANDKAINSVKNRAVFIFLSNFARDACMQATNLSKIYKIAK
jgi:hypothetical protein